MRKTIKQKPFEGDTRIKSGFLWFPKIINNEWRWREYATWEQKYICYANFDCDNCGRIYSFPDYMWTDTKWI